MVKDLLEESLGFWRFVTLAGQWFVINLHFIKGLPLLLGPSQLVLEFKPLLSKAVLPLYVVEDLDSPLSLSICHLYFLIIALFILKLPFTSENLFDNSSAHYREN